VNKFHSFRAQLQKKNIISISLALLLTNGTNIFSYLHIMLVFSIFLNPFSFDFSIKKVHKILLGR